MISESDLKKERDYLKTVLYILEKQINNNKEWKKQKDEDTLECMKYVWDNQILMRDDLQNELYYADQVNRSQESSNIASDYVKTFSRMIKSAYFARIDFDDGEEILPVYIGIASLEDGRDFYVYDWRAPISSMFYDYELGDASYSLPSGDKINGKIILKRQYKIENDKIIQIFDTELQVIDKILQNILQDKSSSKMKNIVKTIQKEQNKVIRKQNVDILVVQGPAGSGKTSVAMHRIAFLLYAERDTLKYSNILIISPNDMFSDYISAVLPEIGEDNVYQTTFMDFIRFDVKEFKIKTDMNDIFEELFITDTKKPSVFYNSIKLKFSATFINLIENYLSNKRIELLGINDIKVDDKIVIEKAFINKFADELNFSVYTLEDQHNRMMEKLMSVLDIKLHTNKKAKEKIFKTLNEPFKNIKIRDLYLDIYSSREMFCKRVMDVYNASGFNKAERLTLKEINNVYDYTFSQLSKGVMPFEDVSCYLYLKDRVFGNKSQKNIKYVMIDEAQDYTIMQYKILAALFKDAKVTLLGDLNQSIMPFAMHSNYESIINIFKNNRLSPKIETNYLSKTYRSTMEINTFSKKILGETSLYNQVDRHGQDVAIIKDTKDYPSSQMIRDAIDCKMKYNTVAIICKTESQVDIIKKSLPTNLQKQFKFISKNDKNYDSSSIMVIPSYMAKGLEFDVALIAEANKNVYSKDLKKLFYVVCTRALHKLNIYYTEEYCDLNNSKF